MVLYCEINFGVQVQPGWHVFPSLQPPFLYPPATAHIQPHPVVTGSHSSASLFASSLVQLFMLLLLPAALLHEPSSPLSSLSHPSGSNLVFLRKCPLSDQVPDISLSPYFCYISACIESYLSHLLEFWGKRSYFIYSCVFHLLRLNENSVNEIFETKFKNLLVIPWFHLWSFNKSWNMLFELTKQFYYFLLFF